MGFMFKEAKAFNQPLAFNTTEVTGVRFSVKSPQ